MYPIENQQIRKQRNDATNRSIIETLSIQIPTPIELLICMCTQSPAASWPMVSKVNQLNNPHSRGSWKLAPLVKNSMANQIVNESEMARVQRAIIPPSLN